MSEKPAVTAKVKIKLRVGHNARIGETLFVSSLEPFLTTEVISIQKADKLAFR
jgi:hypothetical protein